MPDLLPVASGMCQSQVGQKARSEPDAIQEAFKELFLQNGFSSSILAVKAPMGPPWEDKVWPLGRYSQTLQGIWPTLRTKGTAGCMYSSTVVPQNKRVTAEAPLLAHLPRLGSVRTAFVTRVLSWEQGKNRLLP